MLPIRLRSPYVSSMIRAATSWLQGRGAVLGTRRVELLLPPHVGQHVLFLLKSSGPRGLHPRIRADHSYFALCLQQIDRVRYPALKITGLCGKAIPISALGFLALGNAETMLSRLVLIRCGFSSRFPPKHAAAVVCL